MEFDPWGTISVFQQLVQGWAKEGLSCRRRIEEAQRLSMMNITEYKRQCVYQSTGSGGPSSFLGTFLHLLTSVLREMHGVS